MLTLSRNQQHIPGACNPLSTALGPEDPAVNKTKPLLSWSFNSCLKGQIIKTLVYGMENGGKCYN